MLELHVLGPAFSLPSIDAHCLAAVAYLSQAVPKDSWRLIASPNPAAELPALRDGDAYVTGFDRIVRYLRETSRGEWDLDADLDDEGRADVAAYASLLNTQGQALLDLSLYVSSANYSAITRPVYSTITTFPLSWLRPHRQRSHAKSRTAHLGLSSLDVDAEEREAKEKSADSPVPQSLRRATTSITASLFASPEDAARIRLDALASAFFDPLAELLANKRFFLPGAAPTSLDCLALAYLALALFPDLPSPWLRTCLQARYPGLCKFVHDTQRLFFGGPVTVVDAGLVPGQMEVAGGGCTGEGQKVVSVGYLPWVKEGSHDSWGVVRALFGQAADSLPVVREWREGRRLEYVERDSEEEGAEGTIVGRPRGLGVAGVVVGVLAGMGAMAGLVFYHGPIFKALGMRPPQKRIQAQPQPQTSRYPSYGGVEPGVARLAAQMDSFGR